MEKKPVEVLVFNDTDKDGIYWVAFNEIGFDAFKSWLQSVALAKNVKLKFKTHKKQVSFRTKTR